MIGIIVTKETMMTVNELIQQLQTYPGDMRVLTLGYEEGYDDISIRTEGIVFDYNDKDTWYIGPHECAKYAEMGQPNEWQSRATMQPNPNANKGTKCVIIGRGK
jgi:hypothetical protein